MDVDRRLARKAAAGASTLSGPVTERGSVGMMSAAHPELEQRRNAPQPLRDRDGVRTAPYDEQHASPISGLPPFGLRDLGSERDALDLLVWYWGRRGGPVRLTYDIVRELRRRNDVRLSLSLSRQSELFQETSQLAAAACHVDTYSGPASAVMSALRLPLLYAHSARFVRQNQIRVALCMMRHTWSSAIFPALRRGGARVLLVLHDATPHPGEEYPLWRQQWSRDLAATDGLVVLSEHVFNAAVRIYRYPEERIWFAPHLSLSFTEPASSPRELPRERPIRLLFFGRLLPYKGLDLLASAFQQVARDWPIELRVVGNGPHAALEVLRGLPRVQIERRWIPEHEIGDILRQADILVAPYRESSQSGIVPSAYAAGVPVVVTPVGGLVEQVRDGTTGLIAPRADAAGLAETIIRLISDPGLYRRCSAGSLAVSQGDLSAATVADRLIAAAHVVSNLPPRA